MGISKRKGQIAEAAVLADATRRGYHVAIPFSEDCQYDLVVDRRGELARVQCKYTESAGGVVEVRGRSTNGWVTTKYTESDIDWLAVYDATSEKCYFVPASMLGPEGRSVLHLRLAPTRNGQKTGVRWAKDFTHW